MHFILSILWAIQIQCYLSVLKWKCSSIVILSILHSLTNSLISSPLPDPKPYCEWSRYFWVKIFAIWRQSIVVVISDDSDRLFPSSNLKLSEYANQRSHSFVTYFIEFQAGMVGNNLHYFQDISVVAGLKVRGSKIFLL